jgi:hypothetical protein
MTGPGSAGPTPEKRALIEAYDEALRAGAERQAAEARPAVPQRRRRPLLVVSLVLLALTAVYLVIARPEWLTLNRRPVESAAVQDASLRLGLAMQAQRIRRYQRENGRLPETLADAGAAADWIRYERFPPDRFALHGENGAARLTLRSTDSLEAFVGNSFQVIQQRTTP